MKDRKKAALFAILLGGLGVHKFYLNDTGTGVFYIMLTIFSATLGFPVGWLLAWIDAFQLLTMSDERFDKKYNNNRTVRKGSRAQRRTERRNDRRNPYQNNAPRKDYEEYSKQDRRRNSTNPYNRDTRKHVIKDNPFKNSGLKRLKDFELDLAEEELTRALELSPDDKEIHFGLGKVYSLTEKTQKAFYHISKALEKGFSDTNQIKTADEFAYIRIQPEFEAFENSGFRVVPRAGVDVSDEEIKEQSAVKPPEGDLLQNDMLLSQLNKLAELRKKGLLSEREFEEEKIKLMRR